MTAINTRMNDGRALYLRPLKKSDAPLIEAGIIALSDRSRYLRFFSAFKKAPQSVIDRLTDFDDDHIAWGAVDASLPDKPPIAAAHIIPTHETSDDTGEYAIAVLDEYHNLGVARYLTHCLFKDAMSEGYSCVTLDVLVENRSGLDFFKWLGSKATSRSGNVVHMKLELSGAVEKLASSKRKLQDKRGGVEDGHQP